MSRKPLVFAVAALIVLVAAAGAYAYGTTGGGSGAAGTSGRASLVVNQTSTVASLGPGVAAQSLSGNFDNGADEATYVGSVSVVVTDTDHAGCTAADYTITGSPMVVDALVPVGTGQGAWTGATIAFNNRDRDQNTCQGATVHLAYSIVATGT